MPDTEKDKNMSKVPNHLFIRWAQNGMNTNDIIKSVEYNPYINDSDNSPKLKIEGYKPEFNLTPPSTSKSTTTKTNPVGEIPLPLKRSTESPTQSNTKPTNITSSLTGNYAEIDKALQKAGYSKNKRAAILATVEAESSGNPNAVGDGGLAVGLFQWHPDRQNFKGGDLNSQIDWMTKELSGLGGGWLKQTDLDNWNNSDDLESLVRNLTYNYIRPADKEGQSKKRLESAQKYLKLLS